MKAKVYADSKSPSAQVRSLGLILQVMGLLKVLSDGKREMNLKMTSLSVFHRGVEWLR